MKDDMRRVVRRDTEGVTGYNNRHISETRAMVMVSSGNIDRIIENSSVLVILRLSSLSSYIRSYVCDMIKNVDNYIGTPMVEKLFVLFGYVDYMFHNSVNIYESSHMAVDVLSKSKSIKTISETIRGMDESDIMHKVDNTRLKSYMWLRYENPFIAWIIITLSQRKFIKMDNNMFAMRTVTHSIECEIGRLLRCGVDVRVGSKLYNSTRNEIWKSISTTMDNYDDGVGNWQSSANEDCKMFAYDVMNHARATNSELLYGRQRTMLYVPHNYHKACYIIKLDEYDDTPQFKSGFCYDILSSHDIDDVMTNNTCLNRITNSGSLTSIILDITSRGIISRTTLSDMIQDEVSDMIGVVSMSVGEKISSKAHSIFVDTDETRFRLVEYITIKLKEWVDNEG